MLLAFGSLTGSSLRVVSFGASKGRDISIFRSLNSGIAEEQQD
jgi:hypothetical protein